MGRKISPSEASEAKKLRLQCGSSSSACSAWLYSTVHAAPATSSCRWSLIVASDAIHLVLHSSCTTALVGVVVAEQSNG